MHIDVKQLVTDVSSLISLPEIYLKVRALIDDPSSDLDDFSAVVNSDPGLAAVVLKIVNSAFFNFPGKIDNINRALNLIGIGQLHDLVLSLSALKALDFPNDIEPLKTFWQRSIYSGTLAKLLAQKNKLHDPESLFVSGLLHEIGHILLFMKFPEQSKNIVHQADTNQQSLIEVENELLGTDFGKIGQALMEDWNLPYKLQCITGAQSQPEAATEYQIETMIIHIAHKAAVNRFPGADSFQYVLEQENLDSLNISEDDMTKLHGQALQLSNDIEKVILRR